MKTKLPALIDQLRDFAIHLSDCNNLPTLIEQIENFLERFTPLDHSGLYLYDKSIGRLRLLAARGFTEEEKKVAEETAMERHPGEVFRSKKMLNLGDRQDATIQEELSSPRSFKVRSRLYLPVMNREECVGAFGIISKEFNAFDEQHVKILSFLCDIAGIAYGRIMLEKEKLINDHRIRENDARLQALNSRIDVIIKNLNAGILVEDEHRKIALTNQLFCDLFAIPADPHQMVGADCSQSAQQTKQMFLNPEKFVQRIDEILEQKIAVTGEELQLADGRVFERDYIPIFILKHYRGHLWQYRDITIRKQTETELTRLSFVAKHTDNIVIITDKDGKIEWVNNSFWWVTGYTFAEAIGKTPGKLLQGPDTSEEARRQIREGLRAKRSVTVEILNYKKSGQPYWLLLNINPILDKKGQVVYYIAIESDITQRKETEESIKLLNDKLIETNRLLLIERDKEKERVDALEKLAQMKSEFVSSVSHELRTPLSSIIGFAETIQGNDNMPVEMRQEFLNIMLDESKRLATLIDDLLDLGRIESGRVTLNREIQNVKPLLKSALTSLSALANSKNITMTLTVDQEDIVGDFDANRLRQVLINLIGNAIKFTPEGGAIDVACKHEGTELVISIADTGLGIPAEDIPFLFSRFYRVHRPGLEIRGTGLGLTITKHLIEMHGGSISLQSEVGKGTSFFVRIPAR